MSLSHSAIYESLHVLVVDDQPLMRKIIRQLLNQQKIKDIVEAENGDKALEYIRKHTKQMPDVVICDLYMDGMDGMQFAHQVWRDKLNIPIIILTGESDEFILDVTKQAGATKVMTKPVSSTELGQAIGEVIGAI
jgi:two-component system, chemotaxis family, chemotaxis protein CheY